MSAYIARSIEEAKQVYEHDLQTNIDTVEWTDDSTTLDCKVLRNSQLGTYCGYVKLLQTLQPSEILDLVDAVKQSVHGGITYCDGSEIGFDCAHYGDYSPSRPQLRVWTLEAVKNQVKSLALAIHRATRTPAPRHACTGS